MVPNRTNFLRIDVRRVLAQMKITAPFFAGIAYTLGAQFARLHHSSRFLKGGNDRI